MNEKSTSEFKISLDDGMVEPEDSGAPTKRSVTDKKKEGKKPARKPSWFLFILVLLIAVAMAAGYMDIRNRLLSFHSSGSQETRHLSEDLQTKFSTLTTNFSSLETTIKALTETDATLSASVSSLGEAMKKAEKSIAGIKSSKADQKSLDKALNDIEKKLTPLSESVKKITADTAVMSAKLSAGLTEMATLSDKVAADIKALKLEALEAEKASKTRLVSEIDHIENVLKTSESKNDKQAANLSTSLRRLELRIRSLEVKAGITPPAAVQPSDSNPAATTPGEQTSGNPSPETTSQGELIERDITQ